MALNKYILTANAVVAAGTPATPVPGSPGTGGPNGNGAASTVNGPVWANTYVAGQAIILDPAGALFTAIGGGNLRLFVDGQDTVGHGGLAN